MNIKRYPVNDPKSKAYKDLIQKAQKQLKETGCASFPNFFTDLAVEQAANEAKKSAKRAFVTDSKHNAFQLPGQDENYPETHPRNLMMRTRVASIAYDELDRQGPVYKLYNDKNFINFVKKVINKQKPLYRLGDPLGACTINVFRPGWYHAWHFDESEFTTTLCLQQSDEGGEFEFTEPLRNDQSIDECAPSVASVINVHSQYSTLSSSSSPTPQVNIASFEPGTLQIFAGRYSFHRVKSIPMTSTKDRLVAVLCFSSEPNVVNSSDVQKMFWGRTTHKGPNSKL